MDNEKGLAWRVGRFLIAIVSSITVSVVAACVTIAAFIKCKFKK